MANASVEKLKALGLRHGEKAVVGLTAALCLMFLFLAATRPTIDLTPEQVKQAADGGRVEPRTERRTPTTSSSGSRRRGSRTPASRRSSRSRQKNLLVADNYRPHQLWVTPEPGAGLIRDTPELIAPTELYAYPGRGGALVFELDENGNRIPDPDAGKAAGRRHDALAAAARSTAIGGRAARARMRRGPARRPRTKKKREIDEQRRLEGRRRQRPEGRRREPPTPRRARPVEGDHQGGALGVDHRRARLQEAPRELPHRPEAARGRLPELQAARRRAPGPAVDGTWSDWEPSTSSGTRRSSTTSPRRTRSGPPRRSGSAPWSTPCRSSRPASGSRSTSASLVPKEKLEVAQPPPSRPGWATAWAMPDGRRCPR